MSKCARSITVFEKSALRALSMAPLVSVPVACAFDHGVGPWWALPAVALFITYVGSGIFALPLVALGRRLGLLAVLPAAIVGGSTGAIFLSLLCGAQAWSMVEAGDGLTFDYEFLGDLREFIVQSVVIGICVGITFLLILRWPQQGR